MSTFLITGGAGFIGSNIVRRLIGKSNTVRVLDNLSTGTMNNLQGIASQIEFIEGDCKKIEDCRKAVTGCDFVLHHAAIPSVRISIEDPISTNETNVTGTLNMLRASHECSVTRFVYAASSAAYGDLPGLPKNETMQVKPLSPYALHKLIGEQYCGLYSNLYKLSTVCLRYFNVFGPNQDPNSHYSAVIPKFIQLMLEGRQPTIFGDGETTRDFIYVDDVVSANLLACSASDEIISPAIINIASGKKTSLNHLVEKINSILKTAIKPIYADEQIGDVKHSLADISLAKRLLNYAPAISFEQGLASTIDSLKQHNIK